MPESNIIPVFTSVPDSTSVLVYVSSVRHVSSECVPEASHWVKIRCILLPAREEETRFGKARLSPREAGGGR
jgi:hypothetical protein